MKREQIEEQIEKLVSGDQNESLNPMAARLRLSQSVVNRDPKVFLDTANSVLFEAIHLVEVLAEASTFKWDAMNDSGMRDVRKYLSVATSNLRMTKLRLEKMTKDWEIPY